MTCTHEPQVNRFADEYDAIADNAWFASRGGVFVMFPVATLTAVFAPDQHTIKAAAGALVAGLYYWLRERRYKARLEWIRTTDRWWERGEEAPTLMVFPRTIAALRRQVERIAPRNGKRHLLR